MSNECYLEWVFNEFGLLTVLHVWRMVRAESHDLDSCSRRAPPIMWEIERPGTQSRVLSLPSRLPAFLSQENQALLSPMADNQGKFPYRAICCSAQGETNEEIHRSTYSDNADRSNNGALSMVS